MRGSGFILDCINLLYYKFHKINFKRGGSYNDWIKKKKATINPKNDDERCFQYAATIVLSFDETKKKNHKVYKY